MDKVKVNQDTLYQYLQAHDVNLSGLAREMVANPTLVAGCFKHNLDRNGKPRHFTAVTLPRLNAALGQMAVKLRQSVVPFGSSKKYTNNWGNTYDPGSLDAIKNLSKMFNLTSFIMRVLGWNEKKKNSVMSDKTSKSYRCVSQDDVNRINAELLAVAGVLGSYEVVADGNDTISIE